MKMRKKLIDYMIGVIPYLFLAMALYVNWTFFLAKRPRLIEISYMNYIFFIMFLFVTTMIFLFMREDTRPSQIETGAKVNEKGGNK